MGQNWIKWTKGLHRKAKVIGIAGRLGKDPIHAAALCMVVWEWADDNTRTGYIPCVTQDDIDGVVSCAGFGAAMREVGWLKIEEKGGLTFPKWKRHNSESAKQRALSAERMARKRDRDKRAVAQSMRNKSATNGVTTIDKTRGDKRWRWVLRKLDVVEMEQPPALLGRYRQLVAEGYFPDCEARQHEFFGFVAKAFAEGENPPAMLYTLLTEWDISKITNGYADEAARMLKKALHA